MIEFKIEKVQAAAPALRSETMTAATNASWTTPPASLGYQAGPAPEARIRVQKEGGNRVRFYAIVAIIGALMYYLLSADDAKNADPIPLRSPEEIEKDLEKTQERIARLAEQKQFRTPEEQQRFQESHQHYLTGFRDYQKGQYSRALRAFQTARAIDPTHELAGRYSVLAERKRDEWITLQMMEGRRYLEKSMYRRCSAALDKVMDEIANSQDIKFKEAQALKAECELMRKRKY